MPLSSKSSLRETCRLKRDALSAVDHAKFSHAACEKLISHIASLARPGAVIAGYASIRSELEVLPALKHLAVEHSIALPVTMENKPLSFRRYHPGDTLALGRHHLPEPALDAETVIPDILIVPLLAFDRTGHRLGYGKGYYDAALAALRAQKTILAIGAAFSLQETESLPSEAFDQRLDAVITEKDIIRF